MASDKVNYSIALDKWQSLHHEGLFSVPPENGGVAVLLPYEDRDNDYEGFESYDALSSEANILADALHKVKHEVMLAVDATEADMEYVLDDRSIASIIVIGHGCLSSVYASNENGRFDWFDISRMSTHLKTGKFIQRFCGGLYRDANVPLGMFAMDSVSKVLAPVGKNFTPSSLHDRENQKIKPVSRKDMLTYRGIKKAFPKCLVSDTSD